MSNTLSYHDLQEVYSLAFEAVDKGSQFDVGAAERVRLVLESLLVNDRAYVILPPVGPVIFPSGILREEPVE